MLKEITLDKFKCFNSPQTFNLSNLNVFTGLNGRGKSSVFQSLLLLAQSVEKNKSIEILQINGKYLDLEYFEDILNMSSKTNKNVSFNISTDDPSISNIELVYSENTERTGKLVDLKINHKDCFQNSGSIITNDSVDTKSLYSYPQKDVNRVFSNFYFISANRLGPTRDERKEDINEINPVGNFGEHKLNMLFNAPSLNDVTFDNTKTSLVEEVNKWLSYIMDGAKIEIGGQTKDSPVLQLYLNNNSSCPNNIKAINFGFGYSYILSIIIVSLIAQPGSTVFIENPEAHLHPRAQSRLTELLCKLSMSGVQVFIETHSEHVINKIRLCSLKDQYEISNNNISMYFFGENFDISKLEIDENGQMTDWPEGFFDEQDNVLTEILSLGILK